MANYYYVKSGGQATGGDGRETTRSTGSFATKGDTNYYDEINDALNASPAPADGDYILVSDAHNKTHTAAVTWTFPAGTIYVVSVDDSNCDQFSAGAKEEITSGGGDLAYNRSAVDQTGVVIFAGMHLVASDDLVGPNQGGTVWVFLDCPELGGNATGSSWPLGNENATHITNCGVRFGGVTRFFQMGSGGNVHIDRMYAHASHVKINAFSAFSGRGSTMTLRNTDLDGLVASSGRLVNVDAQSSDDKQIRVENCSAPSGFEIYLNGTAVASAGQAHMASIGNSNEYYAQQSSVGLRGGVEVDTAQYVDDGSVTYDGTNEFSIQLDSDSGANPFFPLKHKLAVLPAQDLSSAKTVSVEITGSSGLTDNDVWLECVIQDTTNKARGVVVSGQNADYLASGSALTSSSTTWAVTTDTEYTVDVDLGAQTGVTNSNVEVYICVGKASETLNASMPTIAAT